MVSMMSAGGDGKLKDGVVVTPTFPSSGNTFNYTVDRDCKTIIITFVRHGYQGSSISLTGQGIQRLHYSTNFVNASFGTWGAMFLVAYGVNIKKGTTISMTGSGNINSGGSVQVCYIN